MTATDPRPPEPPPVGAFGAVVLAGGVAARLDGADKASLELGGRSLLARSLDAVVDAGEVVVVGDQVRTERPVTFVREDPRHGGPVAALLTGFDALHEDRGTLAVLACDMPFLTAATVRRLRVAASGRDGAVLAGPDGRTQLALVLDTGRLQAVRPDREGQHGMAMRRLLAGLELVVVRAQGREHRDVDTWGDVRDLSS